MMHKRRWLVRFVALLPALLLLVAAEFGLRWYRTYRIESRVKEDQFWKASVVIHRKSQDPTLVYELTPGAEAVREGVRVKINAAGFRDDEFPADVKAGRKRILLLGDSIAWGWGVLMKRAFPYLLEAQLGGAGASSSETSPIVYNFGVDGYSTEQEIRLLETRGYALQPDLVILVYALNDPDTSDGGLSRYYTRKTRFELLHLARNALWQLKQIGKGDPNQVREEYHQYIHSYYRDRIRDQFQRLGRLQAERGVPIVVAVVPVFDFQAGVPYAMQNIHDSIRGLCSDNGLGFIDLYESFRGRSAGAVSLNRWHPNEEGHAVIAKALVEYLSDHPWR